MIRSASASRVRPYQLECDTSLTNERSLRGGARADPGLKPGTPGILEVPGLLEEPRGRLSIWLPVAREPGALRGHLRQPGGPAEYSPSVASRNGVAPGPLKSVAALQDRAGRPYVAEVRTGALRQSVGGPWNRAPRCVVARSRIGLDRLRQVKQRIQLDVLYLVRGCFQIADEVRRQQSPGAVS